jgi:hypothetical protein
MNQLLIGAAFPFSIALIVYLARRARAGVAALVLTPLAMGLCALWAVVPDLPRLLGMHDLYFRLANDPRTNMFFWHYSIDRIEIDSSLYHAGLLLMACGLLAAAWRELYLRERSG